jgi:hypothetical protein
MPVRGKRGKATPAFPPFPPTLENAHRVFHIPTAPAAVLSLPHCSFRFATLSEVGQIKWPKVGQSAWPNAAGIAADEIVRENSYR